ncbi:MAG: hypothetical protein M1269_06170 [Chloroflexi bacterium]|nr:hypothetical protein [Chloroflexota bacterium]
MADAVHDVYFSAMHLGLIVPNDPANRGLDIEYYNFTHRGLDFFESGEISMSSPGLLPERIQEIIDSFSLDPGIVPLVEEAYNCWSMGLLRASMVLIGVAVENVCNSLLEAFSKYPSSPLQGTSGYNNWKMMTDETRATYSRWKLASEILKSIKAELGKSYKKPDWWHIWEPVPEAIHPYYETVRIARNEAAHSLENIFTHAQVGLLLASMPSMIEVMVHLTDFLDNNPYKVTFPQL